uniref:Uncharacterized protein n=1 Tax=Caenorhabditis japonica TaxID=281687 RepID=A0A8R1EP36_CAEJA
EAKSENGGAKNPSREPLEEGQISETPSSQESTNERASRRKIQQPQSLNSMVTHAMVDPIVGYISERSLENVNNIEVEQQFIQQYPGYEMLDLNFISAFDYEPEQDGQPAEQQVQQDFDPVFEQIMNSAEEQNFSAASLPVEAEVVVETAKPINSAASTPNIRHPYQFPDPSPLLSPLPRGISFRVQSKETVVTAIELEPDVVESPPVAPPLPAESSPSAKRREAEHHRERKEEKEHRKERRHGEGYGLISFV